MMLKVDWGTAAPASGQSLETNTFQYRWELFVQIRLQMRCQSQSHPPKKRQKGPPSHPPHIPFPYTLEDAFTGRLYRSVSQSYFALTYLGTWIVSTVVSQGKIKVFKTKTSSCRSDSHKLRPQSNQLSACQSDKTELSSLSQSVQLS